MVDSAHPAPTIDRLTMVYDADGGVVGEARYAIGHLLGRAECSLCDITHGTVRRKATFDGLLSELDLPVDVVHRNEQAPNVADATAGRLPCVAARAGGSWTVLLGANDLKACGGDVDRFGQRLRTALEDDPGRGLPERS